MSLMSGYRLKFAHGISVMTIAIEWSIHEDSESTLISDPRLLEILKVVFSGKVVTSLLSENTVSQAPRTST